MARNEYVINVGSDLYNADFTFSLSLFLRDKMLNLMYFVHLSLKGELEDCFFTLFYK